MFALHMNEKTLPQILELDFLTTQERRAFPKYYINRNVEHYFIRGYVNRVGQLFDYNILPAYVFEKQYEYDPTKIQTDWDIVVRKE